MITKESLEKHLIVNKIGYNQFFDQIKQIKKGLLTVLDAVDSLGKNCADLKSNKEELPEEIN